MSRTYRSENTQNETKISNRNAKGAGKQPRLPKTGDYDEVYKGPRDHQFQRPVGRRRHRNTNTGKSSGVPAYQRARIQPIQLVEQRGRSIGNHRAHNPSEDPEGDQHEQPIRFQIAGVAHAGNQGNISRKRHPNTHTREEQTDGHPLQERQAHQSSNRAATPLRVEGATPEGHCPGIPTGRPLHPQKQLSPIFRTKHAYGNHQAGRFRQHTTHHLINRDGTQINPIKICSLNERIKRFEFRNSTDLFNQ